MRAFLLTVAKHRLEWVLSANSSSMRGVKLAGWLIGSLAICKWLYQLTLGSNQHQIHAAEKNLSYLYLFCYQPAAFLFIFWFICQESGHGCDINQISSIALGTDKSLIMSWSSDIWFSDRLIWDWFLMDILSLFIFFFFFKEKHTKMFTQIYHSPMIQLTRHSYIFRTPRLFADCMCCADTRLSGEQVASHLRNSWCTALQLREQLQGCQSHQPLTGSAFFCLG